MFIFNLYCDMSFKSQLYEANPLYRIHQIGDQRLLFR